MRANRLRLSIEQVDAVAEQAVDALLASLEVRWLEVAQDDPDFWDKPIYRSFSDVIGASVVDAVPGQTCDELVVGYVLRREFRQKLGEVYLTHGAFFQPDDCFLGMKVYADVTPAELTSRRDDLLAESRWYVAHELTHATDRLVQERYASDDDQRAQWEQESAYYNLPYEVRARAQQWAMAVEDRLTKASSVTDVRRAIERTVEEAGQPWQALSEDHQRATLKWIYQWLDDQGHLPSAMYVHTRTQPQTPLDKVRESVSRYARMLRRKAGAPTHRRKKKEAPTDAQIAAQAIDYAIELAVGRVPLSQPETQQLAETALDILREAQLDGGLTEAPRQRASVEYERSVDRGEMVRANRLPTAPDTLVQAVFVRMRDALVERMLQLRPRPAEPVVTFDGWPVVDADVTVPDVTLAERFPHRQSIWTSREALSTLDCRDVWLSIVAEPPHRDSPHLLLGGLWGRDNCQLTIRLNSDRTPREIIEGAHDGADGWFASMRSSIAHELLHAHDRQLRHVRASGGVGDLESYFNLPTEVKAHALRIAEGVLKRVEEAEGIAHLPGFRRMYPTTESFLRSAIDSATWDSPAWWYWTEESRRRALKDVLRFVDDRDALAPLR